MNIAFETFAPAEVVPVEWRAVGDVHVFNPAIVAGPTGLLAFYRIVGPDGGRKIAACRLDDGGRPVPGSAVPFSDAIPAPHGWFADPRVYVLHGRHYLYWNSGSHTGEENRQFIIAVDCATLMPIGRPIELLLAGRRQRVEKNWILFEQGGQVWAIYAIAPHRILRVVEWSDERIVFEDAVTTWWNAIELLSRFGPPRGGAQPIAIGQHLYHFCHASRGNPDDLIYVAQCYEFENRPPFRITRFTPRPLALPNPRQGRFDLPKLNRRVASVVYPAGNTVLASGDILISYGINDEAACLATMSYAELDAALRPVAGWSYRRWRIGMAIFVRIERIKRRLR